jgi:hypothetical protein
MGLPGDVSINVEQRLLVRVRGRFPVQARRLRPEVAGARLPAVGDAGSEAVPIGRTRRRLRTFRRVPVHRTSAEKIGAV